MRHFRLTSLNSIYCLIEYNDRAVRLVLLCKILLKKVAKPSYSHRFRCCAATDASLIGKHVHARDRYFLEGSPLPETVRTGLKNDDLGCQTSLEKVAGQPILNPI